MPLFKKKGQEGEMEYGSAPEAGHEMFPEKKKAPPKKKGKGKKCPHCGKSC
jgi:hypothetical protein